jgi:hypothetical protein
MTKIKIYYFKDVKNMPYADMQDIVVFGQPRLNFIDKYYECVYEIDEKRKIKDTYLYLVHLVQKFTFKDSPIRTKKNVDYLHSIDCHVGIAVGDVISVDDEYFAIEYGKCVKIKE